MTLNVPVLGEVTPARFVLQLWIMLGMLASAALLAMLALQGGQSAERAFEAGQLARIQIADGAVEGNFPESKKAAPEDASQAEEKASPAEKTLPKAPVETTPAETPAETPEASEAEPAPPAEEAPPAQAPLEAVEVPEAPVAAKSVAAEVRPKKAARAEAEEAEDRPVEAPLNPVPNTALQEVAGTETYPAVSKEGLEPWDYYAKPVTIPEATPVVAILVSDLGLDGTMTDRALALSEYVTVSFSPYANKLEQQIERARAMGHETWLDAPMEPEDFPASDPGPLALMKELTEEQNIGRLKTLLSMSSGVVGLVMPAREVISKMPAMQAMVAELKKRGLLLTLRVRNFTESGSNANVLYVTRALDPQQTGATAGLEQQLAELEAAAKRSGVAIGIVDPAPTLLQALEDWIPTLQNKGIALAPVSLVKRRAK